MKQNNFKFYTCLVLTVILICFALTAYAAPAPVASFDAAFEQEQTAILSGEAASVNTPITITYTSADSIRIDEPVGLRFEAKISSDNTALEIGWIVTTNEKLEAAGISADDFTKESPVEMVTGINYSKALDIKKGIKSSNGTDTFTAVLTEIDADNYHTIIIARPYAVDENGTWYGERYMGAISVAAELAKDELYAELTNKQKAVVDSVLSERETVYAEYRIMSGYEIGEDGNGKWRAFYELLDPVAGTKQSNIPSEKVYDKATDIIVNYNPSDVVMLKDGKYVSEDGKLGTSDLTENSLVWLGNYNETDKSFTVVPYTAELGSCEACITEYMNKAQGKNIDFMTGAEIGNKIKITNRTAISVIKYSAYDENFWPYASIDTPWSEDSLTAGKKNIMCYNNRAENESGFYTGYSKYAKAYVSAENGEAKVIVVVVNGNEMTALNEICELHK